MIGSHGTIRRDKRHQRGLQEKEKSKNQTTTFIHSSLKTWQEFKPMMGKYLGQPPMKPCSNIYPIGEKTRKGIEQGTNSAACFAGRQGEFF